MTIETTALRELGRIQVRIKTALVKHQGEKLPAELVRELFDIVERIEIIMRNAAKGLLPKD